MGGTGVLLTGGRVPQPPLLCSLSSACGGEVRGHAPPGNFKNYTSTGTIWRHLGMKLSCKSRFKTIVFMLIQINVKEKKGKCIYKLH